LHNFFNLKDEHSETFLMFILTYTWFTLTLSLLIVAFQCVVIVTFLYIVSGSSHYDILLYSTFATRFLLQILLILMPVDKSAAALILTSVFSTSELFSACVQRTADLENDLVSVERIVEYGNLSPEKEGSENWVAGDGNIVIKDLEVNYGSHNIALRGVTCTIRGGEKVIIVQIIKFIISVTIFLKEKLLHGFGYTLALSTRPKGVKETKYV